MVNTCFAINPQGIIIWSDEGHVTHLCGQRRATPRYQANLDALQAGCAAMRERLIPATRDRRIRALLVWWLLLHQKRGPRQQAKMSFARPGELTAAT